MVEWEPQDVSGKEIAEKREILRKFRKRQVMIRDSVETGTKYIQGVLMLSPNDTYFLNVDGAQRELKYSNLSGLMVKVEE